MGPCTVQGKNGHKCSCISGSCTSDFGTSPASCVDCGHPMSKHSDYVATSTPQTLTLQAPPSPPRAQPNLDKGICPRTNTVKRLAEILDKNWFVHVRGTPSTGKTTLACLLRNYYKARGDRVVYLPGWPGKEYVNTTRYLTSECERAGYPGIRIDWFCEINIIFILDEAQEGYEDFDLWSYIKFQSDNCFGPKLCLFSSYGSPANGMVTSSSFTKPYFGPTRRVSIIRSTIEDSTDICLFYNEAEFEDVVRRYCTDPTTRLSLDKAARTYLFSITSGHPGAVFSMLSYIFKIYGPAFKHGTIQQITEDDFIKALDDDAAVFSTLQASPVYGSFPTESMLTPLAVGVLSKVLQYGSVPFGREDEVDEGMRLCFERGWVHVEAVGNIFFERDICVLPSRLHEKYIEYFLTSVDPKPFPLDMFPTLTELCKAALRRFSRKNLQQSFNDRPQTMPAPRPPETLYQDEFYRALTSLLGNGVGISSPKWGVQVLRDGDRLKDHCDRFLPGGKYYPWIESGSISDWIVLDCRCSRPSTCTPSEPKLWRVVFAPDYSSLCVLDGDNQEIMSEVVLMD